MTCETLHAHTQVLGKLAAALAPPEPQLQHAALRLGVRGWETPALPAPDGSGVLAVELDLCSHEAVARHSDGREARIPLSPDRSVGVVTRGLLAAVRSLGGWVAINPTPQETSWQTPLDEDEDEDEEHATYDPAQVARYFAAATRAALVLAALRAPYRGRSTPVNAWWGSFDLAVSLFSGLPADPPGTDFITRNAMNAEEIAVGWWPGDSRYPRPAFYAYAHPAPAGFADATSRPPSPTGTRPSASTSSTGTTCARPTIHTRPRSPSHDRQCDTRAPSADGTPRLPQVPTVGARRSSEMPYEAISIPASSTLAPSRLDCQRAM